MGGSASCADWPCLDCAVDFSPGGVWIGYIRTGQEDGSLIDAAPVTGSLVSSTLFSFRDVYCTAGFSSYWTFCDTDCVLLAGCQVFLRRIIERWTMAANGASVVEDRAGITFGVELYVPWDVPEVVVDISSSGVVPLRHIPDVIGLVGRREGTAESCVLQGRDARRVRLLVPDCHGIHILFDYRWVIMPICTKFSRRYDSGHGRCAGITCFPSGVVYVDSAVAAGAH